jgi:hypothetical protein
MHVEDVEDSDATSERRATALALPGSSLCSPPDLV